MGLEMSARAEQRLMLLPQMLQSIELLTLSSAELDQALRDEYERNEALELVEPRARARNASPEARATGARRTQAHDELLAAQPAPEQGLHERVAEQIALLDLDANARAWLALLTDCLEPNGYLSMPDERLLQLAEERGLAGGATALGLAIAKLQALEPRGIGARDLTEALLLQLDPGDGDYALLCRLLEDCLDDLARNKLPKVARELGIDLEHLYALVEQLRGLDPRPAASLAASAAPGLRAELVVERDAGAWRVRVERGDSVELRTDARIDELAADRAQPRELRVYLRTKLRAARALISAVEQRRATLLRVAEALFRRQRAFLEHGRTRLVPLSMIELAEELGLHASTVSRAVAGKHAQTPWGILPLREFFQAGGGASEDVARDVVREALRAVVESEDARAPLSDDEIAAEMARRGYPTARRTVAKYRDELGIPSSYRRRRF